MIEFKLEPQQGMVKELMHQFGTSQIRPLSRQADTTSEFPPSLFKTLNSMASGGMVVGGGGGRTGEGLGETPDSQGVKQTNRLSVIAVEELAWADAAVMPSIPGPGIGGPPIAMKGTPEQKERFFGIFKDPKKPKWGAYGLTEPSAGSDVANIKTAARKDGDYWILNGRKCFITNGARASWVVVFATVDPSLGRAGQRAFVVEKGTPGFFVGKIEKKMGLRASETAELILEDVRVHKDNMLGGSEDGAAAEGFKTAMAFFDTTRPLVAIATIGIARAMYEYVRDWAGETYDLARPIPRYQLITDKLAWLERKIDAARLLAWQAAWMADMGVANAKEASMAKVYCGELGTLACSTALDIMGREGLSRRHLVEKWFRDVKVFNIFEGTAQVQRVVISKRIIEGLGGF